MIGSIKAKSLFLRVLPYVISILSGVVLYVINLQITDPAFNGLLSNIAASLLSIPLIFIFYEIVNDICSRNIKKAALEYLKFNINYIIIDIIKVIRTALNEDTPLTEQSLNKLLKKDKKFIKSHLKLEPEQSLILQECKDKLISILRGNPNLQVLSDAEIKNLLTISKSVGILAREFEHLDDKDHRALIEDNFFILLNGITKWIDLTEEDAIVNHHNFRLIS